MDGSYIAAVSPPPAAPARSIPIAMSRLEEEFRHIVVSTANNLEINSLYDFTSLSPNTIHEIDLFPPNAIKTLRSISDQMIAGGYAGECFQIYGVARKSVLELCFRRLGIERLSLCDVQQLEWENLESKIPRWIRAARVCFRILFASERRLCDRIFERDQPFVNAVKDAAIQLLSFAEAISIGRRSPEKLFKVLDLHDALTDLVPDIGALFQSRDLESVNAQVEEIIGRLAEAVRGILAEFENAVLREPSEIAVRGGTIHPLTRYVMNYIGLISDYKQSLIQVIKSRPPAAALLIGNESGGVLGDIELVEGVNQSPLSSHLIWIIFMLQFNIQNKARVYRDSALSHLFLTNNLHYIVRKIKGSAELSEVIGDEYPRKLTAKFRQLATSYERTTWVKILYCLRDEGLHIGGSFSSSVSKSTLRERFRAFNSAFEEVHRTQAMWYVPDSQLREELRISILEKLLPAYRSFLGRFSHHIESGRHPEMYIKYSTEDLEVALADFFEGCPPPLFSRRNSR